MYAAYLLGSLIFILDAIEKYQNLADTSPDPNVTYKKKSFWQKERINIIRICLLGIVSIIFLPILFGNGSMNFTNSEGVTLLSVPLKAALIPLQVVIGWTGGRAILAIMGKSKKELFKKIGLDEKE